MNFRINICEPGELSIKLAAAFVLLLFAQASSIDHARSCRYSYLDCNSNLNGFNFLKKFAVHATEGTKKSAEFSYVLTDGASYLIKSCSNETFGLRIFDRNRREIFAERVVGGKLVDHVVFDCSSTGIYYIKFEVESSVCFQGILAFKRR